MRFLLPAIAVVCFACGCSSDCVDHKVTGIKYTKPYTAPAIGLDEGPSVDIELDDGYVYRASSLSKSEFARQKLARGSTVSVCALSNSQPEARPGAFATYILRVGSSVWPVLRRR